MALGVSHKMCRLHFIVSAFTIAEGAQHEQIYIAGLKRLSGYLSSTVSSTRSDKPFNCAV